MVIVFMSDVVGWAGDAFDPRKGDLRSVQPGPQRPGAVSKISRYHFQRSLLEEVAGRTLRINAGSRSQPQGTFTCTKRNKMKISNLFKSITLALGCAVLTLSTTFAGSDRGNPSCVTLGGSFTTRFIADDQTAGTATGDLKGALGVKLLGVVSGQIGNGQPVTIKVQHFWVTETGDSLLAQDAEVAAYPGASPSQPLLYSFVYEKGIKILGGTGKFDGATGLIKAWGGIDLGAGEVAGRYSGSVCFKAIGRH